MSATDEAGGTRVTPIIFRKCRQCGRPWELQSQIEHKCKYCGASEKPKETKDSGKWDIWYGFLVILVWAAIGLAVANHQEITTWVTQWLK